jgi:two-component system OmpR family sensor kinase
MSLRARVIAGMALIGIVLVGVAFVVADTTRAHLLAQVDDQLREASFGARLAIARPGPAPDDRAPKIFGNFYVGTVAPDGTVTTTALPNLSGDEATPPKIPATDALTVDAGEEKFFTVSSDGSGTRYRLIAFPGDEAGSSIVVGTPIDDVDAAVSRLITVELLATGFIVAVLALVTYWVIRHGVRPIKQMTQTASSIAAGDMSHRVPEGSPGTEAAELGTALNQMLARIEDAFAQQSQSEERLRRFVSDASHELRTPVTTIRGYAELYRRGALDDDNELREAMRRTEQEATRMGSLVDDLLLLARLDEGRELERVPVALDVLVEDAVRDARAVDPDRPINASVEGRPTVVGDEGRLRQVLANLLRNALVHTPAGTPIDVRLARDNGNAVVEVHDDGPGMAPEVAWKVFERVYRADPARTRRRGGTGLGLAIVDATVTAHHGRVKLESAPGSGTTVRVELPYDAPHGQQGSKAAQADALAAP